MNRLMPLLALAAGMVVGSLGYGSSLEPLVDLLLYLLLFLVGVSIGSDRKFWSSIKKHGVRGVLLGISVMVSGGIGAGLAGALLGLDPAVSMAIGAASGWYSLAAPLLLQVGALPGLLGLMVNLFRESLTMVLYPLMAGRFPRSAVALGGATSMDSTLPVIARNGGREAAALALAQGFTITLLAPFVLELLLALSG